jgi:NAD+ kinase
MDKFFVITNPQKDANAKTTEFIQKYLEEKGKICYVQECNTASSGTGYKYTDAASIPDGVDCVLVLGGDGTLLQASRDLLDTGLPLLGINLGTLGYLAEIDCQNIQMALDKLIEGDYSIEDRMMIGGTVSYRDHILMTDIALNDIVIARRGRLRVVDFHIFVDDVFLCSYRADGIIVSTPTGSTGYSLSAGGPIVAPDASLILLTALAPHTLASRPVILPDNVAVTVELADSNVPEENTARVVFDGDTSLSLESGSRIRIMKTEQKTRLVKIKHTSFVEILREKLK